MILMGPFQVLTFYDSMLWGRAGGTSWAPRPHAARQSQRGAGSEHTAGGVRTAGCRKDALQGKQMCWARWDESGP